MFSKSSLHEHHRRVIRGENAGVALITALGMLVLFLAMGTAFLGYVTIDQRDARYALKMARAKAVADGGARAAIGEIQAALAAGKPAPPELTIPSSVYGFEKGQDTPVPQENRAARAEVRITDEWARINLNQAPVVVLQAILGVDGDAARKLRSGLPRQDSGEVLAPTSDRRWLTTVGDLVTRGLMEGPTYNALDQELVTVYSAADNTNPGAYINLNTAPAKVLAAVLNLSPEAANAVVAARDKAPFKSVQDLRAAVGKGPETFNVPQAPGAPDALPPALAFSSRCYRIRSEAKVANVVDEKEVDATRWSVEAVVYFPDGAAPLVQYWSAAK
ncbi:MAG: general secretion pathway protein GspK [Candidatus Hydrogenedentes bacterium]|nr:general secretion pathway protein GspK [Candidatus Hydrogenedentota bacterium]